MDEYEKDVPKNNVVKKTISLSCQPPAGRIEDDIRKMMDN